MKQWMFCAAGLLIAACGTSSSDEPLVEATEVPSGEVDAEGTSSEADIESSETETDTEVEAPLRKKDSEPSFRRRGRAGCRRRAFGARRVGRRFLWVR